MQYTFNESIRMTPTIEFDYRDIIIEFDPTSLKKFYQGMLLAIRFSVGGNEQRKSFKVGTRCFSNFFSQIFGRYLEYQLD